MKKRVQINNEISAKKLNVSSDQTEVLDELDIELSELPFDEVFKAFQKVKTIFVSPDGRCRGGYSSESSDGRDEPPYYRITGKRKLTKQELTERDSKFKSLENQRTESEIE
jgi:hypothetical protein